MSLLRVPIYPTRNLAVEIDPGARSIVAGTNVSFTTNADGSITINASGGAGTVTSVGATGSTGLTVGGSPITTSGTLTFTLSANLQSWSGIAPATKADLASPVFTGDPRAPTPATADNDTSIATTAFVKNQGYATTAALGNYVRLDTSIQSLTQATDWRLAASTTAGSDTLALRLQSGGAFNTSRGAILELNGANAAANAGAFRLLGMAGSTSVINGGSGSLVQFQSSTYEFTGTPRFAAIAEFMAGTVGAQRVHTRFGWSDGVQRWTTAMESDASFSWYNYNTSGTGASRLVNMIGTHTGLPRFIVDGELVARDASVTPGQLRMVGGNYGAFFRNDGTNLYLLMTASGDQYGSWSTLRPMTVNVSTGLFSMANGLSMGSSTGASSTDLSKHIALYGTSYGFSVTSSRLNYVAPNFARHYFVVNGIDAVSIKAANQSGTLSVAGGVWVGGPNAVVHILDRTSSRQWGWYASSDVFRLWNGSSDVMNVTATGNQNLAGYIWPDANTAGSKKLSRISIGTAAPSGLIDGELYLRY